MPPLLALVCVLFTQLAVPAYACPMLFPDPAAVETMAEEAGCGGESIDAGEKGLCQAYCLQGDQSIEKRAQEGGPRHHVARRHRRAPLQRGQLSIPLPWVRAS